MSRLKVLSVDLFNILWCLNVCLLLFQKSNDCDVATIAPVKVAHRPFGKNYVFGEFNTTHRAKKTQKAPHPGALVGWLPITMAKCYSYCALIVLSANSKCIAMTKRACWGG